MLVSCLHQQVLEWLDKHGVVFLNKNTAVGKSLEKAKALHKNFKHFEQVAQVRLANCIHWTDFIDPDCFAFIHYVRHCSILLQLLLHAVVLNGDAAILVSEVVYHRRHK